MLISELRSRVRSDLMDWAWDQWAQLGVSAPSGRADRWAADPEALLLFTFDGDEVPPIIRASARRSGYSHAGVTQVRRDLLGENSCVAREHVFRLRIVGWIVQPARNPAQRRQQLRPVPVNRKRFWQAAEQDCPPCPFDLVALLVPDPHDFDRVRVVSASWTLRFA
jgi:hypothetical protein